MTQSQKVVIGGLAGVCVIAVLCLYLLLTSSRSLSRTSSLGPPRPSVLAPYASKLKLCTRVELEYQTSALENFEVLAAHPGLLSSQEREYLQSLKTSVVSDSESLRFVTDLLSWTSYSPGTGRQPDQPVSLKIRGYRDDQCLVSFALYGHQLLVMDDGRTFELRTWPDVPSALPDLNTFSARGICAQRLLSFAQALRCGPGGAQRHVKASDWCETIWPTGHSREKDIFGHTPSPEEIRKQLVREAERNGQYQCPSAGEGRCHYAMNPDCGPNSPPDTVLIFEAYAGWNQHGGPELFTFYHHHDPRGGCVLLNNGEVRFIRSEEELQQLRWK